MNILVMNNLQNLNELKIFQVIIVYLINVIFIQIILIYALKIFLKVIILTPVMDIMKNMNKIKIVKNVNLTKN